MASLAPLLSLLIIPQNLYLVYFLIVNSACTTVVFSFANLCIPPSLPSHLPLPLPTSLPPDSVPHARVGPPPLQLSLQKQAVERDVEGLKEKLRWTEGELKDSKKMEAQTQAKLTVHTHTHTGHISYIK